MSQKKVEEESVSKTLQDVTLDSSSYGPEDDTIDLSQISGVSFISDVSSPHSDIEPLLTDTSYSSYNDGSYNDSSYNDQLHVDGQNEGYEETDSSSEETDSSSEETDSSSEQLFSFGSDFDHLSPIPKIEESFEFPTHLETPHVVSLI